MKNRAFWCLTLLTICTTGCSSGSDEDGTGGASAEDREFPSETSQLGVEAFLDRGAYREAPWISDAAPRPRSDATSPHGRVRVYFNSIAADSMRAGNDGIESPPARRSMIVKELYDADDALLGRAVSMKVEEGKSLSSWLYYCDGPGDACVGDAATPTPLYTEGRVSACHTCHGGGIFALLPGDGGAR